jgi:hypothetical protein
MMSLFQMYNNIAELRKVSAVAKEDSFHTPSYFLNVLGLVSSFDVCFYKDKFDAKLRDEAYEFTKIVNRKLFNYNLIYMVHRAFDLNTNYHFPDYCYQMFSKFYDPEVREFVAANLHIPKTILEQLVNDDSYYVSSIARNKLANILRQNKN